MFDNDYLEENINILGCWPFHKEWPQDMKVTEGQHNFLATTYILYKINIEGGQEGWYQQSH